MYLFIWSTEDEGLYVNILGLEFVSEENDRCVFLKAGQNMLLIFNPNKHLSVMEVMEVMVPYFHLMELLPHHQSYTLL
jgi:catechol-2,3-dioxygenase